MKTAYNTHETNKNGSKREILISGRKVNTVVMNYYELYTEHGQCLLTTEQTHLRSGCVEGAYQL